MNKILPNELSGPRCYFTDLDPKDQNFSEKDTLRKLKLQLLLKGKVIIAASSIFHSKYYELIKKDIGLTAALQTGVIVPALRSEFLEISDFFDDKKGTYYSDSSRMFFSDNVKEVVSWNLFDNARWFQETFQRQLIERSSAFRKSINISSDVASLILHEINNEVEKSGGGFMSREHILSAVSPLSSSTKNQLISLSNTLYRISGARVVNAEGHFPQSNISQLNITDAEKKISDFEIFWGIFVELISTNYSSVVKISPDHLDRLTFVDILELRKDLFGFDFINIYDDLIKKTKLSFSQSEPDKILYSQEEILKTAELLKINFNDRIATEFKQSQSNKEDVLFELGSAIETVVDGNFFSILSLISSVPKITTAMSKELGDALNYRVSCAKHIVANLTGWNYWQRSALIDGYVSLLNHGLVE